MSRAADQAKTNKSYGQALKASVLIGGSSVIEIGFRIIRAKALALLVGPAGIGLLGIYTNLTELVRNLAGVGLNTSGVRQIAESVGTGDEYRISRTVKTLRLVAVFTGGAGALILIAGSGLVSRLTFGNTSYAGAIAFLAIGAFCGDISEAQKALIQGMRKISDLARLNIYGAFLGTAVSIPMVIILREDGLAPSLAIVGILGLAVSWWYARRIKTVKVRLTWNQLIHESSALIKFGVVFMASGLMWMVSAYLIRIIILREVSVEGAGFYQAAWSLGGLYTGLVFRAMAADFYPRLTAVSGDNAECNRLANEQAEVVLLIASPGVLATLSFAPLVIQMFYSAKFGPAVEILRWICLGMLLQVGSWTMSYIVMAKGNRKIFFWAELLSNVVLIVFVYIGIAVFGLVGAGIGFCVMYLAYSVSTYFIVRKISGFRWTPTSVRLMKTVLPTVLAVFLGWYILPRLLAEILGVIVSFFSALFSLKMILKMVPPDRIPTPIVKITSFLKLAK